MDVLSSFEGLGLGLGLTQGLSKDVDWCFNQGEEEGWTETDHDFLIWETSRSIVSWV